MTNFHVKLHSLRRRGPVVYGTRETISTSIYEECGSVIGERSEPTSGADAGFYEGGVSSLLLYSTIKYIRT